ncbi:MAG: MATE family efflux transporter [Clostridia bacterium]|nr:MATE family efflux transporter [Clostridia bacterium]
MTRDMTIGSPARHLITYALPVLLGSWLQLAYNAVDSIIAGQFIGQDALAAEGVAGPVMNLVILAISGLCVGAGVAMGEAFGAGDLSRFRRTLGGTLLLGLIIALPVTLLGILLTPLLLRLLQVPEDIFDIAVLYLRVTFLGAPFTFLYNALAAGLKSAGDSRTPLRFLAFSSILNAVLDLIFLGLLHFGILCSAITTVAAEAASALLAVFYMKRRTAELMPAPGDLSPDRALLRRVIGYGAPAALQQATQPIGKVLIQGQIDALGVSAIAAFNAVTRVDDFACVPEQGIGAALSAYLAQNRGANKEDRLRPGFCSAILMECAYWLLIGSVAFFLGKPIVALFVRGQDAPGVVPLGAEYLSYMAFFYLLPGLTNAVQGFFRGMGKLYTTVLATAVQITVRTVSVYALVPRYGLIAVPFCCAAGWTLMLLIEIPYYFHFIRKRAKSLEQT